MSKPWQQADLDGWATGTDDSTHRRGDFPIANVVPIPVIGRPTKELVAQWREHWKTMGPVIDIERALHHGWEHGSRLCVDR